MKARRRTGPLPGSLTCPLAGSSSSRVIVLNGSDPLWLLARDCHRLLATRPSPSERECKTGREKRGMPAGWKSRSRCGLTSLLTCREPCQMLSVRSKVAGGPRSRGRGVCRGMRARRQRSASGIHLGRLPSIAEGPPSVPTSQREPLCRSQLPRRS